MKNLLIVLSFIFITINSFSQTKMKITLTNGIIKSGVYKIKNTTLGWETKTRVISRKAKEKYGLKDIENIIMYSDSDSLYYEVISTKKYLDSKKINLKLGQVGFIGDNIELFYVSELVYRGGTTELFTTVSSYPNTYVKRKDEDIAYNMGYIYGAAQRGIKKRVRDFFTDCPMLIHKVDNNLIPKDETLEIALFYEKKCNNKPIYQ